MAGLVSTPQLIGGCTPKTLKIVDVVILREDESNRGYCWIGMAVYLFNAREGVVRTVKPPKRKSCFQRPVQLLYQ